MEKTCTKCGLLKDLSYFNKAKNQKDGLYPSCKECRHKTQSKWYEINKTIFLEKERKRLSTKKQQGICRFCQLPTIVGSTVFCERHWYENSAQTHLKSKKRYEELIKIATDQSFICPYSGIKLIPGVNMSLDHRIPKYLGGTSSLDNLHWVEKRINLMKHKLKEKEFIDLCKLVTKYTS